MEKATFGAGCFWCIEGVLNHLKGVEKVVSGYTGGKIKDPTYREICGGQTGHAEVAQVTFDPNVITFEELLEVFWLSHDPTTLNKQGADVGTQYRSSIFYHSNEQKEIAEKYKSKLDDSGIYNNPIVTEISPLGEFYIAEAQHQNFYENNQHQPYCAIVIRPKVHKIKKLFAEKIKETV